LKSTSQGAKKLSSKNSDLAAKFAERVLSDVLEVRIAQAPTTESAVHCLCCFTLVDGMLVLSDVLTRMNLLSSLHDVHFSGGLRRNDC
jgi:hypothetical protein